ncbi:putative peptidase [Enterococcus mundtii 1A]|uniref:alpha/beta hydrolase family protein n=1 Tax=Enterococcus mundtii TaxID=53346 RepID=UPI0023049181|nr:prolyl oligopeptidase family serine peptidase [Enterococcus mundtii]MDA9429179.1 putative peptidase [Enterococcus mundtii 1A]
MRILSIFFTNDRKCIIASMLSKTGNYRLYYSLYPFEKKDMICENSFMVVPIGIKKGKLIYKEKNQVKHFYVPNCNASGFLNNVRSIDYNTLLYDTYKNLSLSVTNDRGGNIVFVNQDKLNIPLHFIVKNCYFLDSKTLILLCSSTLNSSMLVYYSIPERELNYLKMTSQLTFPLSFFEHQIIGEKKIPCLTHIDRGDDTLLICLHGGPKYHYNHEYLDLIFDFYHNFNNICLVNFPGSTGYSQKYENELIGNGGVVDIEAVKSVVSYYDSQGFKIKIYGESYGAYIAICLSQFINFSIARIVSVSGFTNLFYMYLCSDSRNLIEKYFSDYSKFSPEKNLAMKELLSIRFLHGSEDKTCPIAQINYFVKKYEGMHLTVLDGFSHYEVDIKKEKIRNKRIVRLLK